MSIRENLFKKKPEKYGPSYQVHILEQYKLYVEMADRISSRRQIANSFFLSLNTALIALLGYNELFSTHRLPNVIFVITIAGLLLCYTWYRTVRSYRDLNTEKFKIILEIENRLPISPYYAEWIDIGKGKKPRLYLPFTNIETCIPWIFFSLHLLLLLLSLPWAKISQYLISSIG